MTDSREARAQAREIKFIISNELGLQIREWARANLEPDPHGGGPFGDEYLTTTIYFDTPDLDVWQRRGSFGRAKYRIRRYGDAGLVFLERKLRRPRLVIKRRTRIPVADLDQLDAPPSERWPGAWFSRRLAKRGLRPVCRLSYRRTARQVSLNGTPARLTLDEQLQALSTTDTAFSENTKLPVLTGSTILELKYRGDLPPLFRQLVEEFGLSLRTVSKYRLSMKGLGRVDGEDVGDDFLEHGATSADPSVALPVGETDEQA